MSGREAFESSFAWFVRDFTALMDRFAGDESAILDRGSALLSRLVSRDDWLPDRFARADARSYQQYRLHVDPAERFSVVSFVWGPGQQTPVHDHTVWGLIGMLRGGEVSERYAPGRPMTRMDEVVLRPGSVERLSPEAGDIHRVSNLYRDRVSISIHVYGADIGTTRRHTFDPLTGASRTFVSRYANAED